METDERDILIEIKTKLEMIHASFIDHIKEDSANNKSLNDSIKAAHRRMDWLVGGVVLTIILSVMGLLAKLVFAF